MKESSLSSIASIVKVSKTYIVLVEKCHWKWNLQHRKLKGTVELCWFVSLRNLSEALENLSKARTWSRYLLDSRLHTTLISWKKQTEDGLPAKLIKWWIFTHRHSRHQNLGRTVHLPDHPASCTHKHSGIPLQQTDIKHYMSDTEICTELWSHNLKERDHLEDLGLDEKISKWTTV
jgi:hypothetical protein